MRKVLLPALAGLAALGAVVVTPSKADAQVSIGIGIGAAPLAVQYGYGPGWGRPYYGYGYGYGRPYRPHYGYYRPYPVAPTCWVERRWVDTPWGPEPRRVRICR